MIHQVPVSMYLKAKETLAQKSTCYLLSLWQNRTYKGFRFWAMQREGDWGFFELLQRILQVVSQALHVNAWLLD